MAIDPIPQSNIKRGNGKKNASPGPATKRQRITENAIIRRVGLQNCPDECRHQVFEDHGPGSARLLTGAAAPRRKRLIIWFLFIPIIISYWVAQAAWDWDLRWYCLREGEKPPLE